MQIWGYQPRSSKSLQIFLNPIDETYNKFDDMQTFVLLMNKNKAESSEATALRFLASPVVVFSVLVCSLLLIAVRQGKPNSTL